MHLSSCWGLIIATCLQLVVALPQTAYAQDDFQHSLDAAVRFYKALEYEKALAQLQTARWSAQSNAQEVSVLLHEGIFLGDMGQRDGARAAFKKALLKNPEAQLPFKVSPKLTHDFEEARAQIRKQLQGLNSSAGVSVGQMSPTRQSDHPVAPALNPPAPKAVEPLQPAARIRENRMPVAPLVLVGAGAAAAGVGALFGLQSRSSVNEARGATFQDETRAHLDDARSSSRVANVLFGTAGLAATGALVTWLLSSDGGSAPAARELP